MPPSISFIIPAWNEEALIGGALGALRASADALGEPYEIIVVDDASTDRTSEIARGRFLFFVDADTLVPPETLVQAMDALREGAIGGGSRFVFEGRIPWHFRVYLFFFMAVWNRLRVAVGCFVFVRREELARVGGWDETYFAGEELYLSRALKRRGKFVIVRHPVLSSGRKARLLRVRDLLRLTARALVRGSRTLKQREGLEAWYVALREPPAEDERL